MSVVAGVLIKESTAHPHAADVVRRWFRIHRQLNNGGVQVSRRLERWISHAFVPGSREQVIAQLTELSPAQIGGQDAERVQAALVVRTAGDWDRFVAARRLLDRDWRDVLVGAGLADADWPDRLDAILGIA